MRNGVDLTSYTRCAVVVERDASEFARLSQLGDILGLTPLEVSSVHSQLAEQAYRNQVQQVCLGLSVSQVKLVVVGLASSWGQ